MKKGQIGTGIVQRLDFPNKGLVKAVSLEGIDGEDLGNVIVKGVIPGQTVRFQVNKLRSGKAEARLLEVLEPSARESSVPFCPVFGVCGGCSYQTLPYEEQLKLKEEQVKRLLDGVCGSYCFEGILSAEVVRGYRNKMEFSFGDACKGGPLALGLHKKGSFYDIVNAGDCGLVHKDFNGILTATLQYFTEKEVDFYHKMTHMGYLRHLLVRRASKTEELLIALVTSSDLHRRGEREEGEEENREICARENEERGLLEGWKTALLGVPLKGKIAGILHIVNDREADVVQADQTEILYGQDYFFEEVLGLRFKISTFSFFQTNTLGAEVLYSKAREYVGGTKDKVIFDLYSGTGTIAQILAPVAKKVIGVEIVEEAVLAARENAARNGISNVEFIAGDVLKKLDEITDKPDLIVIDPPRDGVNPKALRKIMEYGVDRIVYISCKPTSLVRDLEVLLDGGYEVVRGGCVDLFPETGHIECVVKLCRVEK